MLVYFYENTFFLFFSLLALISLILIIYSNKEIYSIVFLIIFFLNISCLLLVLKVEFISALIILIYISAITIFFLFIIMTTNLKINNKTINLKIIEFLNLIVIVSIITILNFDFIFNYFTPSIGNKFSSIYENYLCYNFKLTDNLYYPNYINFYGFTDLNGNPVYNEDLFSNYIKYFEIYLPTSSSLLNDCLNWEYDFLDLDFMIFCKNGVHYPLYKILCCSDGNFLDANPFSIEDGAFKPWFSYEYFQHIEKYKNLNENLTNSVHIDMNDYNYHLFNNLKLKNITRLPNISGIYSSMEFHSIFYNFFIIEILSVGFILLITLIGVVVLTTNRGKHLSKIQKNKIIESNSYVFKIIQ